MEAFLHSSLGSSLCGEPDNLVRSPRKITQADKEDHLKKRVEGRKKKQKDCKTGINIKRRDATGTHTHPLCLGGSVWA